PRLEHAGRRVDEDVGEVLPRERAAQLARADRVIRDAGLRRAARLEAGAAADPLAGDAARAERGGDGEPGRGVAARAAACDDDRPVCLVSLWRSRASAIRRSISSP